ncbi:hypothetical protein THAOC_27611 [Thalassiosira oceanica]|uniref:STI1 domain-containing protein n=1 Tax=Thalassiosira oceanica TaxID=159749 RepID=K0RW08_THAOC|nr:hypothetical protein THAOC_27611 [Thalassiosira oceanica]|eukprot:EJK53026.1 hypothetical protein THAOC_27611 [Thalassiosira oceanica]
MKLPIAISALLGLLSPSSVESFVLSTQQNACRQAAVAGSSLRSTPSPEEMRKIMEEESTNPEVLSQSAAAMKNMTPQDMEKLITEMESMPPAQKDQLKAMGMDPDTMLISMKMMKDNPQMMSTAQKLMENMSPEEMLEQSKLAQEKMSSMSKDELEKAAEVAKQQMENISPDMVDEAVKAMKQQSSAAKPVPEGVVPGSSSDPNVIDAMFRVAEMMSKPNNGGVTFQAFSTLPPITTLSGPREQDLSKEELAECWSDGSLGATRVDRSGFERVWNEVRWVFAQNWSPAPDQFDVMGADIMDEARLTLHPKAKKVRSDSSEVGNGGPQIGANLSPDQMKAVNEQVKNMSDDDMTRMLEGMANIGPEEEARMRAMGADPAMMKKAAQMMSSNPLMRNAAKTMMKNMSPEQMAQASQQAQQQMSNMSPGDIEKAMEQMNK